MYNIQFTFDASIPSISNVVITKIDTKETPSEDVILNNPIIILKENKLWFSDDAIKMIGAVPGDRISINYWTENKELTFPVIGKSELFTDREDGNRLTKSNTVSFRGTQHSVLSEYGKFFKLSPFKNYFKLSEIENENSLLEEEENLNKLEQL